ncbi:DNA internalization-related competence protein ComEC/Rec2 [Undibacterium baiyunense]|uniref:DNA internalization-related competence protein ComEC/Rec2 n=1 Tax=Undibacterium baiyunense TaxID=2828731 RepID=A0A941I325_9BURK|nr:DNA internalization-related competence protein ComEC/Rec2 [Undibacterium baiyunense]MBR7746977.1 DNA internalization-related competence protein ComEC/Rec2 [Undibacterium baiyunense]
MRSAILSFVLGVALLQQQVAVFDLFPLSLAFAILCLLAWQLSRRQVGQGSRLMAVTVRLIICFLASGIGFCWASFFAHYQLRQELPKEWEGRDLLVQGVIDQLPVKTDNGTRFNFSVERYILPSDLERQLGRTNRQTQLNSVIQQQTQSTRQISTESFPKRLALGWFDDADGVIDTPSLQPGQRWQLLVRLKRPHGNANPYGFDYEAWLFEQGLRATGSVRLRLGSHTDLNAQNGRPNLLLTDFVWSLSNLIERSRFHLREHMLRDLSSSAYAGVLTALVIGDQRDISSADWVMFNRTGVGHLMSISGLHITMIAGLFASLMHFLWRHSFFTRAQLPLIIPVPKVAVLSGLIAAIIYVALAGFGVPAQRTLWMLAVLAIAIWCGRSASSTHVLILALGVVVVLDPWAVLWPGFWLSFGAVGVLLYSSAGRIEVRAAASDNQVFLHQFGLRKLMPQLRIAARAQYAITFGLVPLTLLLFSQISVLSPIANAVAIPLVSFVVTPLALLGSVLPAPLSAWCLFVAHECVALLVQFLELLNNSSFAVWHTPKPSWWMFAAASLGLLYLLAPRGIPMRCLGAMCCLPLLLQPVQGPAKDHWQVTVFDVGQGSAVLVETAHHRLLYDTGPGTSSDSNSGTRVLLPYLQARGITHLDQLIVSHSDNDHSGGAISILKNLQVDQLLSSLPEHHPITQHAKQSTRCIAGQSWEWDGISFEILHPLPVIYTSDKWKPNALSCTLKISSKSHAMLLTGDIEAVQEDQLIHRIPEKLGADVLLVPHHGSGTSSSATFLQVVKPSLALFQLGYLNRYHHPKDSVLQRYLDFGIKPLRTDTSGAITLQFGSAIQVSEYRKGHARYWHQ